MRKLFTLLLAMVMLAMPLTALAEEESSALLGDVLSYYQDALDAGRRIQYKISYGQLPEELTSDPDAGVAIAALFDSLVMEEYDQGDETFVSIGFEKEDGSVASVLSLGILADGTDAYIKSNLLGADAIVVGADELTVVIGRLIGVLVEMGTIEAEEGMSMVTELPAIIDMIKAQMAPMNLDIASLDFSSVINAILPVMMKMEQVEMTMQPKNCDAAVSEQLLVMNQDDAKKIVISLLTFIKDNPDLMKLLETQMDPYAFMPIYEDMEAEIPTFEQQIDEAIAEIQAAEDDGSTVHIRAWTNVIGEVVYLTMTEVDAEGVAAEKSAVVYNRLTMNDKVAHSVTIDAEYEVMTIEVVLGADSLRVSFSMDENGEFAGSILLDGSYKATAENAKTNLYVELTTPGYEDEEEVLRIDYTEEAALNGVDFVSNIQADISFNGQKMITVFGEAYTADPVPSIKDGNVVRLATLTDAEFANWFAGVMNAIQSWPMTLLMSMPAELLQMMMQTGM